MEQYCGTKPILESEPINIPNARKCRENHGLEIKQRIVYVLTRTNKANDDDTDIYVGSTSQSLETRLLHHRHDATRAGNENNKLYKRMRAVGVQNWEIIPLLSRTCDQKTIREVERKWCGIMHADLSTIFPITTPEEKKQYSTDYYESNKDAIKQYRESNKEVIKQRRADYYKSNREVILKKKVVYRKSNKEAIKQRDADYRKLNKQNKVHYCELCDKAFGSKADLQRHLKSKKHSAD